MLFDLDHWQELFNALARNKLRTAMTAFGVFWGIFMLIVMLGSGNGLENGVMLDFGDRATNSFFVWTRATSKPYRGLPAGRRFELTNQDHDAVRREVPQAKHVCPRLQLRGFGSGNNVTRGTRSGSFQIMGDYPEIRSIEGVRVASGRFLNRLDIEQQRKIAVIGAGARKLLFERDEDPIGESIRINGVYFKIVGLFRSSESGEDGEEQGRMIFLPFTTFQRAFNFSNLVGWFAITSANDVPASVAQDEVIELLKQRHRVAPDDQRAFGHYNLEEEYNEIQGLFVGIRVLVWIVGVGTLAAGVIGVSNIMLVIVRERTNEIGIRRAIGAAPASIMGQIVLEAIVLTAIAGYCGLMLGMGALELTNALMAGGGAPGMFSNPDVSSASALQALSILIISGTLAGIIPARRAVSLSPVQALRTEL